MIANHPVPATGPLRLAAVARIAWPAAGGLLLLVLSGCTMFNYAWYVVGGVDQDKTIIVKSEYHGLQDKKTAVLVAADEFNYPTVPLSICRSVSARLKQEVTGIKITSPSDIDRFQKDNPYWTTMSPGELIKKLKVERLVYIDVSDFGLHEPGNAEIWHGLIDANVSVAEADSKNPDDFVYTKQVRTSYPPDNPVGLLSSDDSVIQVGLLKQFSMYVGGLFNNGGATVPK